MPIAACMLRHKADCIDIIALYVDDLLIASSKTSRAARHQAPDSLSSTRWRTWARRRSSSASTSNETSQPLHQHRPVSVHQHATEATRHGGLQPIVHTDGLRGRTRPDGSSGRLPASRHTDPRLPVHHRWTDVRSHLHTTRHRLRSQPAVTLLLKPDRATTIPPPSAYCVTSKGTANYRITYTGSAEQSARSSSATVTPTGHKTRTASVSPPVATCSSCVAVQSAGRARSSRPSRCPPRRPS